MTMLHVQKESPWKQLIQYSVIQEQPIKTLDQFCVVNMLLNHLHIQKQVMGRNHLFVRNVKQAVNLTIINADHLTNVYVAVSRGYYT